MAVIKQQRWIGVAFSVILVSLALMLFVLTIVWVLIKFGKAEFLIATIGAGFAVVAGAAAIIYWSNKARLDAERTPSGKGGFAAEDFEIEIEEIL